MAKKKTSKKKAAKKTAVKKNPVPKTTEETASFLQAKREFAAKQAEAFNKRFRR